MRSAATLVLVAGLVACSTDRPAEHFKVAPGGATGGRPSQPGTGSGGASGSSAGDASPMPSAGGSSTADSGPAHEDASPRDDASGEPPDACGPAPIVTGEFTRELLRRAAAECARWHYCGFESVANDLRDATADFSDAPGTETLSAARDAWRATMSFWSRLELFQFGPASSRAQGAGRDIYRGEGIRDWIYAWPVTARCRVEDEVAGESYASRGMGSVLISGRGLFALEYLLFYEGTDSACPASTSTAKIFASLGTDDLAARKHRYARAVADDIAEQARTLTERWSPTGGNFQRTFVTADGYPDEQEAMNVLAWALVYVEKELKDWKLGIPAGYTAVAPVNGPESPFALVATENIRENLRGFRSLFQGCGPEGEGTGFDDWLEAAGHGSLATDTVRAYETAQSAVDAMPPLHQASPTELEDAYWAVKGLADLLKNDLFGSGSPLNLKLPAGIASDTD